MIDSEDGCLVFMFLIAIKAAIYGVVASISSIPLNYVVSTWLVYAGKPDEFMYWHAFLCCLFPPVIPLAWAGAFITFVATFFV